MAKTVQKAEAIRLRMQERLSFDEILERVPVARSSLSLWLREHPLTLEERHARRVAAGRLLGTHPRPALEARGVKMPFTRAPSASLLRSSAIGYAIDWFASRGYTTSIPVEQAPYDLIVDSDDGLKRIQVKSTNRKDPAGNWLPSIYKRVYARDAVINAGGRRRRAPYTKKDIDFFFILTGDRSVYLVPIEAVEEKLTVTLDRRCASYKM